jgi:hypothetical protein
MNPNLLEYLINHLFLPPKLPQREDSNELDGRNMLLSHVLESATIFEKLEREGASQRVQQCWRALRRMLQSTYDIHRREHISASVLQHAIRQMTPQGSFSLLIVCPSHQDAHDGYYPHLHQMSCAFTSRHKTQGLFFVNKSL